MWILLLSLTFGQGGVAGFSVSGFTSKQACDTAAEAWVRVNNTETTRAKAVCAATK